MGTCLSGPKVAGMQDEEKPQAEIIKVLLSTGMEVPVWILPSDTMKKIDEKIVEVYGRQPLVSMKGEMVYPFLNAKAGKKWIPVRWDATIKEVSVKILKYSDISDKLDTMNKLRHAHWAASNAGTFGVNFQQALS